MYFITTKSNVGSVLFQHIPKHFQYRTVFFMFLEINNINNNYQYYLLTKGISSGKI